jgi:hypothetical protein
LFGWLVFLIPCYLQAAAEELVKLKKHPMTLSGIELMIFPVVA